MAEKIKDMTRGKPAGLIFTFALPLMLGNVFQQLYTVVDTAVVGQFVGVEALASIGAADWPNWMVLALSRALRKGSASWFRRILAREIMTACAKASVIRLDSALRWRFLSQRLRI